MIDKTLCLILHATLKLKVGAILYCLLAQFPTLFLKDVGLMALGLLVTQMGVLVNFLGDQYNQ